MTRPDSHDNWLAQTSKHGSMHIACTVHACKQYEPLSLPRKVSRPAPLFIYKMSLFLGFLMILPGKPRPTLVESGVVIERTDRAIISFSVFYFFIGSSSSKNYKIGFIDLYWTAFKGFGGSSCTGAGVCLCCESSVRSCI